MKIIQWAGDATEMAGALSWKNWIFCFSVNVKDIPSSYTAE